MQDTYFDTETLLNRLRELADEKYRHFNEGLIPGAENTSLGVRAPALRTISRELLRGDWRSFLEISRNHPIYEMRLLHAMVLGGAKCDIKEKIGYTDAFLPWVDNWAVCDTLCASFKPNTADREVLFSFVCQCAASEMEFRKRFGLIMMMNYYRDEPYIGQVMEAYRDFSHEGYYARMGAAWGLATLFVYQREKVLALLQSNHLDEFTHNKAIQKMRESYRISPQDKAMLRDMRRKNSK